MIVSCYCLTYGRTHLLEESIKCFLRQDWEGPMELVVLNDLSTQRLAFDHPQIRIVNVSTRYATLADKYNAAARMCRGDVLLPWDDDDLYLPNRVRMSVRGLRDAGAWRPKRAWSWRPNKPLGIGCNQYHAQWALTRRLFDEVGGYPAVAKSEDTRLRSILGDRLVTEDLPPEDFIFIFRWATGTYHVSAHGFDRAGRWAAKYARRGEIELRPHWERDYLALVTAATQSAMV